MASFLSTHLMKVDKKGRVSVPAPFRTAIGQDPYAGILCFVSLAMDAVDARSRGDFDAMLDHLRRHHIDREGPDMALLGGGEPSPDQILAAIAHELPFDGEGRIVLPDDLMSAAGITDQVRFVGRGSFFQLWDPARFAAQQLEERRRLRERLLAGRPPAATGGAA